MTPAEAEGGNDAILLDQTDLDYDGAHGWSDPAGREMVTVVYY